MSSWAAVNNKGERKRKEERRLRANRKTSKKNQSLSVCFLNALTLLLLSISIHGEPATHLASARGAEKPFVQRNGGEKRVEKEV
jgi:hypothetical protein